MHVNVPRHLPARKFEKRSLVDINFVDRVFVVCGRSKVFDFVVGHQQILIHCSRTISFNEILVDLSLVHRVFEVKGGRKIGDCVVVNVQVKKKNGRTTRWTSSTE